MPSGGAGGAPAAAAAGGAAAASGEAAAEEAPKEEEKEESDEVCSRWFWVLRRNQRLTVHRTWVSVSSTKQLVSEGGMPGEKHERIRTVFYEGEDGRKRVHGFHSRLRLCSVDASTNSIFLPFNSAVQLRRALCLCCIRNTVVCEAILRLRKILTYSCV